MPETDTPQTLTPKRLVYLAGPIEIVDTWRERAGAVLDKLGFESINPLRGEDFKKSGKYIQSDIPDNLIVMRDVHDMQRCSLSGGFCLMNLSKTAEGRNPIGTLCELEWCYEHRLPVIGVVGAQCDPGYKNSPWVKTRVSYRATSVTDALTLIENYFV